MVRTARRRISLADAAAMDVIGRIADRAVALYAKHGIHCDRTDVVMNIQLCHFYVQRLRLDDLASADDGNFLHDIGGINKYLDRGGKMLKDYFSPRYSARV